MWPVASRVAKLTAKMMTSGTTKKAASQTTPGRMNSAPPRRDRSGTRSAAADARGARRAPSDETDGASDATYPTVMP